MTTRIDGSTTLTGHSLNVENDLRVMRQLEKRGQELQMQLWDIEERWQKRRDQIQKRRGANIRVCYSFADCLC